MKREDLPKLIELTLAVYRLTDEFPEREILRGRIRQLSLEILENFILGNFNVIIKKIPVLEGYFLVASRQNWVKEVNFPILLAAFRVLGEQCGKKNLELPKKEKRAVKKTYFNGVKLNERQTAILELLKGKTKGISYSRIVDNFKNVTPRTISNDLMYLTKEKILSRKGWGNSVIYMMK